jgi:hypothetical protein
MKKERLSFSGAVLMSLFGLGVSVFSTNQLFLASAAARPLVDKSPVE